MNYKHNLSILYHSQQQNGEFTMALRPGAHQFVDSIAHSVDPEPCQHGIRTIHVILIVDTSLTKHT